MRVTKARLEQQMAYKDQSIQDLTNYVKRLEDQIQVLNKDPNNTVLCMADKITDALAHVVTDQRTIIMEMFRRFKS